MIDAGESALYADGKGQAMYTVYQARLRELNACDFGDLLLHNLTLLKNNRDVLEEYQAKFKYILSTNIRIPTPSSISGCGCSRRSARISLVSAMTTSRSIRGAGRRLPISCGSKRIFRAQRSSGSNRITARPRTSLPPQRPDRGEQRTAGQDAVDRSRQRRKGPRPWRVGRAGGSAADR
jgi:hypothetical protein